MDEDKAISELRKSYKSYRLTLYLGAGVSVGSGLPSWNELVHAMYFSTTEQAENLRRAFPNYLLAIAKWHLERSHEPLDITARKLRDHYSSPIDFLNALRKTLYASFICPGTGDLQKVDPSLLLDKNRTLQGVATLCSNTQPDHTGVRAVITYNYDNLLEHVLKPDSFTPIWNSEQSRERGKIPVYHVHGYLPTDNSGSSPEHLILTEDQYHLAAQDSYAWANLVQLKYLTSTTGLMVGVSLTDRNMRRLLDAVQRTPLRSRHFAILQRPQWQKPSAKDLNQIHNRAVAYFKNYRTSGIKASHKRSEEIEQIIGHIEELDHERQTSLLKQLGVYPIWYDDHSEVPALLNRIMA